jgi:hypothetical protein
MKKFTIVRNKGWFARLRSAKIIADALEIGSVKAGESIQVQIPNETIFLYVKMDWGYSERYPAKMINDGQILYLNSWFTFNPLRNTGVIDIPMAFEEKPR